MRYRELYVIAFYTFFLPISFFRILIIFFFLYKSFLPNMSYSAFLFIFISTSPSSALSSLAFKYLLLSSYPILHQNLFYYYLILRSLLSPSCSLSLFIQYLIPLLSSLTSQSMDSTEGYLDLRASTLSLND